MHSNSCVNSLYNYNLLHVIRVQAIWMTRMYLLIHTCAYIYMNCWFFLHVKWCKHMRRTQISIALAANKELKILKKKKLLTCFHWGATKNSEAGSRKPEAYELIYSFSIRFSIIISKALALEKIFKNSTWNLFFLKFQGKSDKFVVCKWIEHLVRLELIKNVVKSVP